MFQNICFMKFEVSKSLEGRCYAFFPQNTFFWNFFKKCLVEVNNPFFVATILY